MRERAARLGAELTIGARQPHGTFVEVVLGEARPPAADPPVGATQIERGTVTS